MHHVWGLPVAFYLFLSGLGASLFMIAVMADWYGGERFGGVRRLGGALAPWPVIAGVLLLVADLGRPDRSWEFVLRAGPGLLIYNPSSVMSTGTWLIVVFSVLSLLYCVMSLVALPFPSQAKVRRGTGMVGMPFALLLSIYTGVLLSATAVPLWATAMLPTLFVASAAVAGLAAIALLLGLRPVLGMEPTEESVMEGLESAHTPLTGVVLALALAYTVRALWVGGGTRLVSSPLWWVFVVALGLVAPLVFGLVRTRIRSALAAPAFAAFAVLGEFFMRYTILMSGQA